MFNVAFKDVHFFIGPFDAPAGRTQCWTNIEFTGRSKPPTRLYPVVRRTLFTIPLLGVTQTRMSSSFSSDCLREFFLAAIVSGSLIRNKYILRFNLGFGPIDVCCDAVTKHLGPNLQNVLKKLQSSPNITKFAWFCVHFCNRTKPGRTD